MIINQERCKNCGKCSTECYKGAIKKNNTGKYTIDQDLCVNCKDVFDVECIRVCVFKAITDENGIVPEIDRTWRLRAEHISWVIAVMGARDNTKHFPVGTAEWDLFRKLIAAAYIDPELEVRLTKVFDDMCAGCLRKTEPGHAESSAREDDEFFETLEIVPGAVMKFWDVIKRYEEKCDKLLLQSKYDEDIIGFIREYVSPGAKIMNQD